MGTTSTENITRTALVRRSLRRIGNANPSNSEVSLAVESLNFLIKRIDVEGRWLWAISNTATDLATVIGQRSYNVADDGIDSNILQLEAVDKVQGNNRTALDIIDKSKSLTTVNRDLTGQAIEIYLETAPLQANQKIHVFPTPSLSEDLEYYFRRRLYDFTAAADNPDMPGEWIDALTKRLAAEMSPEYGLPIQERNDLRLEANEAMRLVGSENAEEAPVQTLKTLYF